MDRDLTSAAQQLHGIESPAKAYTRYAIPGDDGAASLSSFSASPSKLDLQAAPVTAAVGSTTLSQPIQGNRGRLSNALKWIKKNQKFLACLWSIGASGWSDACLGALLPFIQSYYSIGYKQASLLFLATCIGYFFATCTIGILSVKFGRGKVITFGAAVQVIGYAIMIAAPPFPVLPCGWAIVAFGAATQLAQTNSYVATLPNPHQALGSLHGAYGLGGAASPLIATAFASAGIKFSYFFAVSLSFAAINVSLLLVTFRLKRDDTVEDEHHLMEPNEAIDNARAENGELEPASSMTRQSNAIMAPNRNDATSMKAVLQNKIVITISLFLMLYCGAEVAIGGWIVTFLREDLGGTDAIGYAATGFWLGIAAGRVILPSFSLLIGERRVVFLYILLSLGLEFVVWFSRDLYAAAVCTAFIGFFIGPFFPNAITLGTKFLPKRLHMGAITIFACFGSVGNALFPFATGMLASVYGIWVLQPIVVSLMGGMAIAWSLLPRVEQRRD